MSWKISNSQPVSFSIGEAIECGRLEEKTSRILAAMFSLT